MQDTATTKALSSELNYFLTSDSVTFCGDNPVTVVGPMRHHFNAAVLKVVQFDEAITREAGLLHGRILGTIEAVNTGTRASEYGNARYAAEVDVLVAQRQAAIDAVVSLAYTLRQGI